jgi:hypothetical protein
MDSPSSGQDPVVGIYEHGDEPLDTIKGKIISQEGCCLMKLFRCV